MHKRDVAPKKVEITPLHAPGRDVPHISEASYRKMLSLIPTAVYSCAVDGVITFYNEEAARLWGRQPLLGDTDERFCGSDQMILMDGTPLAHQDCPMAVALREGRSFRDQTVRIRRPDGSIIEVVVNIDPVRDDDGMVTGAINAFYDVSAIRNAEQALRERARTLEALNRVGSMLAAELDTKKLIQAVTDAATEASGARFGAFFFNTPSNEQDEALILYTVCGASREAFEKFGVPRNTLGFEPTFRGRGVVRSDDITMDPRYGPLSSHPDMPEGQLAVRSYLAAPVIFRSGSVLGVLLLGHPESGMFDELTEKIVVGIAAQAAVALDTARLYESLRASEQRYRLVAESLRDADRRKDEFLAMLAHELRNPLAPLLNGLEILRFKGPDEATVEHARSMMERQLGQMVRLIDNLLDSSRITGGSIELRRDCVELLPIVQQAVETSRPVIDAAGHELLIHAPSKPVWVDADSTRLAQVVSNLLNNAAKFTERGGHISLTIEPRADGVSIAVKDDGIGIPEKMLPSIFEMFMQVDRSTEKSRGGLGIGLTLVKRLVELHGGTVEARSQGPGMGSEFVVDLPVAQPRPSEQPADRTEGASPRRRILVVDDSHDSADSLALLLEMMGNETVAAFDGLEAVTLAESFRPDVILLDIGMPKLNGYDTCRRLREQPWGKDIVIVALTGWGQEADRQQSREAGFSRHLVKPVEFGVLEQLLVDLDTRAA